MVTKPGDANKPVWKVGFPTGSTAADWTVTAVVRQPQHKGALKGLVGRGRPIRGAGCCGKAGTVKVTAGPHTRFVFKHGSPDLRRVEDQPARRKRITALRPSNSPPAQPAQHCGERTAAHRGSVAGGRCDPRALPGVSTQAHPKPAGVSRRVLPSSRSAPKVDSVLIDVPAEWRRTGDPEIRSRSCRREREPGQGRRFVATGHGATRRVLQATVYRGARRHGTRCRRRKA